MKNFYIYTCESRFDEAEFFLNEEETTTVEGQKTVLDYYLIENASPPSYLQIRRNFGNAIKSLGGTILYDADRYLSGKIAKNNREVWVSVQGYDDGYSYRLTILEVEEMVQEVTASDMLTALNQDGYIALYINFETGKADIQPESMPIIEQIAALLEDNPTLKVSIEGHTDNVGSVDSNKVLSEKRAQSVYNELISRGIEATRLSAVGWGQERPIADNRTEDGRAKNRRVEIVKK
jgi:outer membrane protein OmpA-like peptidoglycan-associated protein